MKINCIFQGGGANLATLLCAVEALGSLEEDGFLTISEVAGTSAGSIAAACLAHPKPNTEVIQRIVSIAGDRVRQFKIPSSRVGIAFKVFTGSPLLKESNLEKAVRDFFSIEGKSFSFDDTQYPLKICSADIRRSTPVIFDAASKKPLEEAIVDSCAIPIVFRTHSSRSSLADGGVMANLLDQSVFSEQGAHTLAFSFQRNEVADYDGIASYAGAVLGSMIDNAVSEARVRILQSGGYVCELPSLFGTLGFEAALDALKDDAFRLDVVEKCKIRIRSGLEDFHRKSALIAHGDRIVQLNELISKSFDTLKVRDPYRVIEGVIACKANCLFSPSDNRSRNPDLQTKRVVIEPTGDSIQFFRIGIAKGSDFSLTNEISCRVFDKHGDLLSATFEVSSSEEDEKPVHRLCVVLEVPHLASDGPITISMTTTHQQGLMDGLKKAEGNEWMRAEAHRDDEITKQDFILLVPKDFQELHLSDLRDNIRRCKAPPENLTSDEQNWVTGRVMTDTELDIHQSWLQSDPAYRYIGWRVFNVTGRSSSGVLIEQDIGD